MTRKLSALTHLYNVVRVLPDSEQFTAMRSRLILRCMNMEPMEQNKVSICLACGVDFHNVIPHNELLPGPKWNKKQQKLITTCQRCGMERTTLIRKPKSILTSKVHRNTNKKKKKSKCGQSPFLQNVRLDSPLEIPTAKSGKNARKKKSKPDKLERISLSLKQAKNNSIICLDTPEIKNINSQKGSKTKSQTNTIPDTPTPVKKTPTLANTPKTKLNSAQNISNTPNLNQSKKKKRKNKVIFKAEKKNDKVKKMNALSSLLNKNTAGNNDKSSPLKNFLQSIT